MELTLKQVAAFTGGKTYGPGELTLCGVQIDSRKVLAGDLFVALRGETADGHSFVHKALEQGTAALVNEEWAEAYQGRLPEGRGLVGVTDPQTALQSLARAYRDLFKLPVVGITGSSGKTSTKDMIAAVLAEVYCVHKTSGNFNNELGLPLTLLGLNPKHQAAVLEMGMRGLGEIEFLTSLARPNVGVITNIGTTHLELLGSQANIARAKGELLLALPADGTAVLNGDDPWCQVLGKDLQCKTIYYGVDNLRADIIAKDIKPLGDNGTSFRVLYHGREVEVLLPVPGRHNVLNALAAIGVGVSLEIPLEICARGLAKLAMTGMRLEIIAGPQEVKIINDTYNANPASTRAALEVLAERAAGLPKIAVLGSMFELGSEEESGHRQVGAFAAGIPNLTLLITVGEIAELIARGAKEAGLEAGKVYSFADAPEAVDFLRQSIPERAWILVKGSRGMKMERVVKGLLTE